MKKAHFTIIFILIWVFQAQAEGFSGYMRLEGKINTVQKIVFQLYKANQINPKNQKPEAGIQIRGVVQNHSETHYVSGYLNSGVFNLIEMDSIAGQNKKWILKPGIDKTFTAIYSNAANNSRITIQLKETYNQSQTPIFWTDVSKKIFYPITASSKIKPEAVFQINLPVFEDNLQNTKTIKAYDQMLTRHYQNSGFLPKNNNLKTQLDLFLNTQETEWKQTVKQNLSESSSETDTDIQSYSQNTEYTEIADVMYNEKGILILNISSTTYFGGAEKSTVLRPYILDLEKGYTLHSHDIISTDHWPELRIIAENTFKKQRQLSENISLESVGMFFDELIMPQTISVNAYHLILIYQANEIAPPALGIIEIKIPWKQAIKFLPENSPIHRILQN